MDIILHEENVMWPDSNVDKIQLDKHLVGPKQIDRTKGEPDQIGKILSQAKTYVDWLSYWSTPKLTDSK